MRRSCELPIPALTGLRAMLASFLVGLFVTVALPSIAAQNGSGPRSEPCGASDDVFITKIFSEYGAYFAAKQSVKLPSTCIFSSEHEVSRFHATLDTRSETINGVEIELQDKAMDMLMKAIDDAEERGLKITPLDGSIAGKRNFADTLRIWESRFVPALNYWVRNRKIAPHEAERARNLPVRDQLEQVLGWESQGLLFGTGRRKPIMSSVAPPGTSQHLSLVAFDIEQAENSRIREILNRRGWYQTVIGDSPHFTFLGFSEAELPKRGLQALYRAGIKYWVPRSIPAEVKPETRTQNQVNRPAAAVPSGPGSPFHRRSGSGK